MNRWAGMPGTYRTNHVEHLLLSHAGIVLPNSFRCYAPKMSDAQNNEQSDEELMRAVCAGKQLAYQTLVDRHFDAIARYAFRLLGNRAEVEDIAQETFLRMWTQASKWEARKSKLTTWLHRIAHNLCVDHLRKHSRVELRAEHEDYDEQGLASNTGEDDKATVADERIAHLNRAIGQLPENQRSALALCHYQSFSNKEAADIMGLSVRALESLLSRAKRALRSALAPPLEH